MNTTETTRFIIGIDLGTTNSALAYVDTIKHSERIQNFSIPQITAPGTTETLETLPSFHYEPATDEFRPEAIRLPWQKELPPFLTGAFARDHGMEVPARQIASAKSWLCHAGVDRTAAILPWHGANDVTRLSPSAACSRLLLHMRNAWDHAHPSHPMHEQDVIITVPASFDEVARELTVEAAAQAGLPRIILIEEPQAAFYNWIHQHHDNWQDIMHAGETVLVCDIGGGTTDFTLIQAKPTREGPLQFHRIAVGNHLILGGDNLDLALARHIESKYDHSFTAAQYSTLIRRCRHAKEVLLGNNAPEQITINLPSPGARLIASSIQFEVSRDEALDVFIDGFLPQVTIDTSPDTAQSGFREFGLPYAPDPGITRYLAHFLRCADETHSHTIRPDSILLNGGFFAAPQLRDRLISILTGWFNQEENWTPRILDNNRLDLAVARGAAAYGNVRRGTGAKIKAGIARTYYIGIADTRGETCALCLVPAGLEEGETVEIENHIFEIQIRQPVEFPIYCSAFRTTDTPGAMIPPDPETLKALPPIRTILRSGKKKGQATVRVKLTAHINETGTLQVRCHEVEGDRSWRLQFDVRSATQTDLTAHTGSAETAGFVDSSLEEKGRHIIRDTFAGSGSPDRIMKRLEEAIDSKRSEWPPSLLRAFWEELIIHDQARLRTAQHEARWLNLLGFCLRPGYGFAVDDWRVSRTWQLIQQKLAHPRNEQCCGEWWILWRRVCGGLNANQQKNLAAPLIAGIRTTLRGAKSKLKAGPHEQAEIWRLIASLEWLDIETKIELGEYVLVTLQQKGIGAWNHAALWAIARLGARQPIYGPLNTLVPIETVEHWTRQLLALSETHTALPFTMMQLTRRTHDRFRDISPKLREEVIAFLEHSPGAQHYLTLIRDGGDMDATEMKQALGDTLPPGLVLAATS